MLLRQLARFAALGTDNRRPVQYSQSLSWGDRKAFCEATDASRGTRGPAVVERASVCLRARQVDPFRDARVARRPRCWRSSSALAFLPDAWRTCRRRGARPAAINRAVSHVK